MTDFLLTASQAALCILQQGVQSLAGVTLPHSTTPTANISEAIAQAKKLLDWQETDTIQRLNSVFDRIHLEKSSKTQSQYWIPGAIADQNPSTPYPQKDKTKSSDIELQRFQAEIKPILEEIRLQDWQNLSYLMMLLEKYGSFVSLGQSDVALIDLVRAAAAIAAALTRDPQAQQLCLVSGGLSGIQNFIYTISSDGALKSLRARSFYLELVTEEIVHQLLTQLQLPRTNLIYAGGGSLYLLAPTSQVKQTIHELQEKFNRWLLEEFQGKVFLSLDQVLFPIEQINQPSFAEYWEAVIKKIAKQKSRKFAAQISKALEIRPSFEPCRVCHRDDVKINNIGRCPTCDHMFNLGGWLPKTQAMLRSTTKPSINERIELEIDANTVYYALFENVEVALHQVKEQETVLLINDWQLSYYQHKQTIPLLLANYYADKEAEVFMQAEEFAEAAQGIKRVGYLRMDVDRLGQIFAQGLGKHHSFPRLAGLSRQMSYFFKVYLNSLARDRSLPEQAQKRSDEPRPNLLFIYAGGDDLFISGAWNEIVDFAFDVYQSFRAYTGHNPDITLSGGIQISDAKYPLYQAARESGTAEDNAKANGRDSLGLFDQAFKWREWIGQFDQEALSLEDQAYLKPESRPPLFGVLPFVRYLDLQLKNRLPRSFIQNLLATADLQKAMLKEAKERNSSQLKDIRYFLHLPKIAYIIARAPKNIRDDPDFSQSLKNAYNAPYLKAIATWVELLNRNTKQ